jgi:hypothetical protein
MAHPEECQQVTVMSPRNDLRSIAACGGAAESGNSGMRIIATPYQEEIDMPTRPIVFRAYRWIGSLAIAGSLLALAGSGLLPSAHAQTEPDLEPPASLTQIVRDATRPFLDINQAIAAGYGPFLGCVSGPESGAMGIHYVNGPLVGDGELDPTKPEALMYEVAIGRARLLGVEFIVDAATWLKQHDNQPPVLEGQAFQFVGSPNRYALPAFFELHVWAWRDNPNGMFVDWNPRVTCEKP